MVKNMIKKQKNKKQFFSFFKKNNKQDQENDNSQAPVSRSRFGVIETKTPDEILDLYENNIVHLFQPLQISEDVFKAIYIPFLKNVANLVQSLPCPTIEEFHNQEGLFRLCLTAGNNAAKKRMGYTLPPGGRTDLQTEQKHAWTYAVFTTAIYTILQNHILDCNVEVSDDAKTFKKWSVFIDKPIGDFNFFRAKTDTSKKDVDLSFVCGTFLLLKTIPENGLEFLMMYDNVFKEWTACCTNNESNMSCLKEFTNESYLVNTTILKQTENEVISSNSDEEIVTHLNENKSEKIKSVPSKKTKNDKKTKIDAQRELPSITDSINESNNKIDNFFNWVKEGIGDGELLLNNKQSLIFGIEAGIFINLKETINKYCRVNEFSSKIANELETLIINDKANDLQKNSSEKNIHKATRKNATLRGIIVDHSFLGLETKPLTDNQIVFDESNQTELESF